MLKTDDGSYVTNDYDIVECAALFYKKLFIYNFTTINAPEWVIIYKI